MGAPVSFLFPLALSTAARAGDGGLLVAFLGIRLGSVAGQQMPTTPEHGAERGLPSPLRPSSLPGPWALGLSLGRCSLPHVSPPHVDGDVPGPVC